jgi:hypothetical protein
VWYLPLAVGIQLRHYALRARSVETIKPTEPEEPVSAEEFDALLVVAQAGLTDAPPA